MNKKIFKIGIIFVVMVIIILSLMPNRNIIQVSVSYIDKVGHFLAYFTLSVSLGLFFIEKKRYIYMLLLATLLGLVLEKIQSFVGRTMSIQDVYANISGLLFGFIFIKYLGKQTENILGIIITKIKNLF